MPWPAAAGSSPSRRAPAGARRTRAEVADQESLFPAEAAAPFGSAEALIAARLSRDVPRARHRELHLGIAACALAHGARLWTLNPEDFGDVPGCSSTPRQGPEAERCC